MRDLCVLAIFGVFEIGGFLLLRNALRVCRAANESVSWPFVIGTVTDAKVQTTLINTIAVYNPVISYTYSVDGQSYSGNRYNMGDEAGATTPHKEAYRIVDAHQVGSDVKVYYDPESPDICMLQRDINNDVLNYPSLGAGFMLFGILIVWLYFGKGIGR